MKKLFVLLVFIMSFSSFQKIFSQCKCSDGSIPDSIGYEQYFDSIVSTNTLISFPQFDPSVGVLSCIKMGDTVTTVVNYSLENNLDTTEDYNFETYRRSQFTGPDGYFSSILSPAKDYGPYTLGPYDPTGTADKIDIGPDTVFNKRYYEKYVSGSSSFYGTGTVSFNYLTTSTFTILTGSDNAIIKLQAYTRLDVKLVYYWCPFSILETRLKSFTVSLKDNNVLAQWAVNDPSSTDNYEIEMSTDGKEFKNLGEGISSFSGNVASFKYVYNPANDFSGNLFFRIKQTDDAGKVVYSEIRSVALNKNATAKYSLYPNPTISGLNIQFLKSNAGNYLVELFNSVGQSSFKKKYSITQGGSINIEWAHKPSPGIYYLKVTNLNDRTTQVEKLQVL